MLERWYFFEDLKWRAKRGEATADDVRALVDEIRREPPRFNRSLLMHTLGDTRALEHEALVAQYLYAWHDFTEAAAASFVLCKWGLLDKYEKRLLEFLRGVPEALTVLLQYGVVANGYLLMKTGRSSIAKSHLGSRREGVCRDTGRTNGVHFLARFNEPASTRRSRRERMTANTPTS